MKQAQDSQGGAASEYSLKLWQPGNAQFFLCQFREGRGYAPLCELPKSIKSEADAEAYLAKACNSYASDQAKIEALRGALADVLVCIRDRPECSFEVRKAARALLDAGLTRVCNRDLTEDLNA